MNKKKRHLYFLIGTTFMFLLLIQVFIDELINENPVSKLMVYENETATVTATTKPQNLNFVKSITLDRSILRLNPNDQRQIYSEVIFDENSDFKKEGYTFSSSDESVATVNQSGVVTGISNGDAIITLESESGKVSAHCTITVQKVKYLAMTFDDGPGPYTDKLVNQLTTYNSRATFFILGYNLENYKEQLKHAYESHMQIGNHTYHHKNLKDAKSKYIRSEINSNRKLIYETIGAYPTLLRPPYGVIKKSLLEQSDVPIALWSVDTEDWEHQNVNYLYKYIMNHAGDGEIILMHDIHKKSVEGFLKALPELLAHDYELVTVSELYQLKHKEMVPQKIYYGTNLKSK